MKFLSAISSASAFAGLAAAQYGDAIFSESSYNSEDVFVRDVAVVGGGSTGVYGAISLIDQNRTVMVIEREGVLGGMTNTYIDPVTGNSTDYGVQSYLNTSLVRGFFERLNVPYENYTFENGNITYADFKSGQYLPNFTNPFQFSTIEQQLDRFPYLRYTRVLPNPVPEELLIPFSEYITRNSLQSAAYLIYSFSAGVANILQQTAFSMLTWFDGDYILGIRGGNIVTRARRNVQLYENALEEFGDSALLRSEVIAARRTPTGSLEPSRLVVRTPNGNRLIIAKQILIAFPQLLRNMRPFDVDEREEDIFSRWSYSGYYNGLINGTGLRDGTLYINAATNATYNIPSLPDAFRIWPTRTRGLFYYWFGSASDTPQPQVESYVTNVVRRLTNNTSVTPNFVAINSHTPFKLVVSAEAIAAGHYTKFYDLQGHRNTWYTGAALFSHNAGTLWNFTSQLTPRISAAVW